jgi:hypothetical protein
MRYEKKIREKVFILASFLSLCGIKFLYSVIYSQEPTNLKILRVFGLLIFSLLSLLSYRGNKIPTFIMAIIILFSGLGSLATGALIAWEQIALKILFLFAGVLFTYGGIKLFQIAWTSRNYHPKPGRKERHP